MQSAESNGRHIGQAYFLLRVGVGLSFALHGAMRFADLAYFQSHISIGYFQNLETAVLYAFAYGLPALEVLSGFLLSLGFKRKFALPVLGLVILVLLLASIAFDAWESVSIQLIFFFILYWLFRHLQDDRLSFDRFLKQ